MNCSRPFSNLCALMLGVALLPLVVVPDVEAQNSLIDAMTS